MVFQLSLKECFIDREHSATDEVGENIVPENLEKGEYIVCNMVKAGVADKLGYKVDATITKEYRDILTHSYGMLGKSITSGLCVISFGTDTDDLSNWLNGNGNSDNEVKVRNGVVNIRIGADTEKDINTQEFSK